MTNRDLEEFQVGEKIGSYEVLRKEPLPHLKGTFYRLVHSPTGARHIHIAFPDDNNAFCVIFPTLPSDSSGAPHILEHVVLAGSKKYPVRDPFFSMMTRSLKTFMNALTSSDGTAYPFSTRNEKDFYNLLSIYLDATLFPLITEDTFRQEGHRLEFEVTDDPSSGLKFKGVVFNEMKAQHATAPYIMFRTVARSVLPDLPYAYHSGGDPDVMPDLTWKQLRAFHARHYHPSNGFFFTSGDLPLSRTLAQIDEFALSRFEPIEVDVKLDPQPRFDAPREVSATYPLSKDEETKKKSQASVAWLTTETSDTFQVIALSVLDQILLGNDASPLKKALISSGLGDALADGTGFYSSFKEAPIAVGLKGIDASQAQAVESIILETLETLVKEGIPRDQIDAAIHQYEIATREVTNAHFPYSLRLFFQLSGLYVHGGDPYRALQFDDDIERLRAEVESGPFFEELIRRWLLDNTHRVRILLEPDQELEARRISKEQTRLAEIETALTDEQKHDLVETGLRLKASQDRKEDLSVLPTLELSDVPLTFDDVPGAQTKTEDGHIGLYEQPTNGLSYLTIHFDGSKLPERLVDRLALFAYVLPRTGAKQLDYAQMATRIDSVTGGISASPMAKSLADGSEFAIALAVSGKALVRNNGPFVEVLGDLLTGATFEPKRLGELIAEYRTQKQSSVVFGGDFYARLMAASRHSPVVAMNERLSGLTQLAELKRLADLDEEGLKKVALELEEVRDILFAKGGIRMCITSDETGLSELGGLTSSLVQSLKSPRDDLQLFESGPAPGDHSARTTSVPVAYTAKTFPTVGYTHPDAPYLLVLGEFLRANYIHREIREKGGAYGGRSSSSAEDGYFAFGSYRDPHISRTFKVFEEAVEFVAAGGFDPEDVKEAVLSVCSHIDPLESPDTKGRRQFFDDIYGYTRIVRERFKRAVLATGEEDLVKVAKTYLTHENYSLAVISSAEKVSEANKELGHTFKDVEAV